MKVEHEDLGALKHRISVSIDEDGFKKERRKLARKYADQVKTPGFRPGHAPLDLVLKSLGPRLEYEVRENLISETFSNAVLDNNLHPSTEPKFDMVEDLPNSMSFTAEFEVFPEFEIQNYMEVEITEPSMPEVAEKAVDERIQQLLKSMSRLEEKSEGMVVEESDMAECKATIFNAASGEEMKAEHTTRIVGGEDDEPVVGMGRQILGMKAGEEKTVVAELGKIAARGLKLDSEEVGPVRAVVKIEKIRFRKMQELTDEFAKSHGEVDTVEEFRAVIRKQLEEQRTAAIKDQLEDLVLDKICENNPFEIGELTIQRLADMAEKEARDRVLSQLPADKREEIGKNFNLGIPREQSELEAKKNLTRSIILEAVADKEGINITDTDLDIKLQETADAYNMPVPQIRALLGEERLQQLARQLRVQKVMDLLTRYAVVKPAGTPAPAAGKKVKAAPAAAAAAPAEADAEKKPAKKAPKKTTPKAAAVETDD